MYYRPPTLSKGPNKEISPSSFYYDYSEGYEENTDPPRPIPQRTSGGSGSKIIQDDKEGQAEENQPETHVEESQKKEMIEGTNPWVEALFGVD